MKVLNGQCMMASYPKASMKASLAKLSQLPATTRIFCGHEYTVGFGGYTDGWGVGEMRPIGNDGCLSGVSHQPEQRPGRKWDHYRELHVHMYINISTCFPYISIKGMFLFVKFWQMDRRTKKQPGEVITFLRTWPWISLDKVSAG